jgi:hypothetical protein
MRRRREKEKRGAESKKETEERRGEEGKTNTWRLNKRPRLSDLNSSAVG